MDSRPPVRSHFTADGHPFPVRPRSSPMHARRVYRQVRMDDSE
jgi:E3 SUMO-protein ligase PIAS1